MVVSRIEMVLVRHELSTRVRLGRHAITTRDIVSIKVETNEGVTGYATGASRGTPVLEAVRTLAPAVIGADPLSRAALMDRIVAPFCFGRPAMLRASGLLDIALWDIAARAAGLPLHRLLGGARTVVPALQVCGYGLEAHGEDSVLDELRHFKAVGFERLKLMWPVRDVASTSRFLERCREAVGGQVRLAVDLMYSLEPWGMVEAESLCQSLDELDLAFIEDPFDAALWRLYARLASTIRTPVVTGEDISHRIQYLDLLRALPLVRVDPLTADGITGAQKAVALAEAFGARVLPHGHHALNAALGGAYATVDSVEVAVAPESAQGAPISPDCTLRLDQGNLILSEEPGNGLCIDWEPLARCAIARWFSSAP